MSKGLIPPELVEDIKDRTDMVSLVEAYIPLTKKGRNYWGLCPFHLEDTPSFSVSGDKQIYYCFGCHKGGNAISFLMEYKNLNFPDAVRELGERAGITIPEEEMTPQQKKYYDERKKLIAVNQEATKFFQNQLNKSTKCKDYLARRGVSQEMIEKFALGFAPDSWDGLKLYLKKQGFNDEDMAKAGVVSKSENNRVFDRFRNRLMFPICDAKGNDIAFVGRILEDGDTAKYVNTEGTAIYHKGKTLYALNLAIPKIRESGEAVVMEGNLDVVSAHQFGVENAIAPQGTALTEDQAMLLKKYCHKIFLAYDSDNAGKKAAMKNMDILVKHDFRVYIMEMPDGLDPDDVFHKGGTEAWNKLKQRSLAAMSYKIKVAMENYDVTTAEGKSDAVTALGPSLISIKDNVERNEYVRQISEKFNIDENLLQMDMQRKIAQNRTDIGHGVAFEPSKDKGLMFAKEYILRTAMENKKVFDEIEANEGWDFLEKPTHLAIIKLIKENYEEYTWEFRDLPEFAEDELKNVILRMAMDDSPLMAENNVEMFKDCRGRIHKDFLKKELKILTESLKNVENGENSEEEEVLLRKFDKIQKELRNI
ncbi:MAG: DNA primase [Clostridiales bacterium]